MKKIILFLLIAIGTSCSKTEDKGINENDIIESIKSMSKLGTTEYTITKVIAGEDSQWYSIGSRKIMLQCTAHIVAGIDAGQIQFTEVDAKMKKIKVTLPQVEIITFNIPPDKIKYKEPFVGPLRSNFSTKEKHAFEIEAEKKIKQQIKELNIITESEKNAKLFIESILRAAGFVSIEIRSATSKK